MLDDCESSNWTFNSSLLFNPLMHITIWQKLNSPYVCKFVTGNALVAMFTLVIIAVERYHALVKPMATRLRLTQENFHYAIIGTRSPHAQYSRVLTKTKAANTSGKTKRFMVRRN